MNASDAISFEPGKQLPNSLTVEVAGDSDSRGVTLPFLLFVPQQYSTASESLPLLLFLHGLGESGDGTNLDLVKRHGPPKLVDRRPEFPFVVVSPQCLAPHDGLQGIAKAWKPDLLVSLIDHVADNLRIDRGRVYVTGLSMGGYGAWRLAATYPERIAAVVPICGGGEPEWMAAALARVPAWAFHGARDAIVPVAHSKQMVDAICRCGGRARITIYPEVEHDSWTCTYDNEQVYEWLLEQRGPER